METERLLFRELIMTDAPRLFAIYSDKEAMKFRQVTYHKTIDDSFKMLKRTEEVKNANYEFRFGIINRETNTLIGSVMYQPNHKKAIIGYSIAKENWGYGYATEVVNWLINYLKLKQINTIEAWVINENMASCKVLEKNKFKKVNQTIYPHLSYYQLII